MWMQTKRQIILYIRKTWFSEYCIQFVNQNNCLNQFRRWIETKLKHHMFSFVGFWRSMYLQSSSVPRKTLPKWISRVNIEPKAVEEYLHRRIFPISSKSYLSCPLRLSDYCYDEDISERMSSSTAEMEWIFVVKENIYSRAFYKIWIYYLWYA